MPGRDFVMLMESPMFARSGSLKSHKVLPRRRILLDHVESSPIHESADHRTESIEPPPKVAETIYNLPLTPPPITREKPKTKSFEKRPHSGLDGISAPGSLPDSGLHTPVAQLNPPTPDTTPPINARSASRPASLLASSRHPSSRTDSFKTAREQFSSDDEGDSPLPSLPPLLMKGVWTKEAPSAEKKEVGLGLDLESEDGHQTPTARRTPRIILQSGEFGTFDGTWSPDKEVANDPFIASEPAAVRAVKQTQKTDKFYGFNTEFHTPPLPLDPSPEPMSRELPVSDDIEKPNDSPSRVSAEKLGEERRWPSETGTPDSETEDFNARRLSTMSGTSSSTIVEAMIVATPPRRRQTLRHAYRNESLRSASSPVTGSNRSSLTSEERQPRLTRRKNKITESANRHSDSGVSMGSDHVANRDEVLPKTTVPHRRSSLQTSATTKGHRLKEEAVVRQSPRPTTAPELNTSHLSQPRRKLRGATESIGPSTVSDTRGRGTRHSAPVIPARSSSLSAPTSRNVSRTTSLTSTSLLAHNSELARSSRHESPLDTIRRRSSSNDGPEKSVGEDWLMLRPRSALLTPFSMVSGHSSASGACEVNEATAITIYPHNNKSVLIVQQTARRGSHMRSRSNDHGTSAILADGVTVVAPGTHSTPKIQPRIELADSPLRHPREAPQPPDLKLIPPTPFDRTPNESELRVIRGRKFLISADGPFSMVKRALSTRRHSESSVSPLKRSLTSRKPSRKHPSVGDDPENNLSPFWRPRGFWDDLSDSEGEESSYFRPRPTTAPAPLKQTLSRRLGSLRLKRRSQSVDFGNSAPNFAAHDSQQPSVSAGFDTTSKPRRRYSIHVPGLADLHSRFENLRAKQYEERREKQRMKLRNSIKPVFAREDGRNVY